jgi:hypothetical protein
MRMLSRLGLLLESLAFSFFGSGIAVVNRIIFFVNYLNSRKLNCFGRFNFSLNCLIVNSYYSDLIEVIFSDRFIKFINQKSSINFHTYTLAIAYTMEHNKTII